MLSLIALSALAFSDIGALDADPFMIAVDGDVVEAGPVGEAELGDFVVVKQWDAALGDFVVIKQWDFAGEIPVEETETSLGDFVIVKQWDIAYSDIVVSKVQDDSSADMVQKVIVRGWDLKSDVIVVLYEDPEADVYSSAHFAIQFD